MANNSLLLSSICSYYIEELETQCVLHECESCQPCQPLVETHFYSYLAMNPMSHYVYVLGYITLSCLLCTKVKFKICNEVFH